MNKKVRHKVSKTLGLLLLLSSSLPFSLAYAETVEEVPTSETTISTMADDPLKDKTESTTDHVPTIEESDKEETQTTTSETTSTEETKTTESSTVDSTKKKPKPKPFGGGIGIQTVNLIEGVDIDADFAQTLRTDAGATDLGASWTGYGKLADQLTDDDMAALDKIKVNNRSLTSLEGIEYAVNITKLECLGNTISSLDLSRNLDLVDVICEQNNISTLDVSKNIALQYLNCDTNQLGTLNVESNVALIELNCRMNQLSSLNVSSCINLKRLACTGNQISTLDISSNLDLEELSCDSNRINNLNLSLNNSLKLLYCDYNMLHTLDVTSNSALKNLRCSNNYLRTLDLSSNALLERLNCDRNAIPDITSLFGLANLTNFSANNQKLSMPVPTVSGNQATVDILKTTAQTGLTATNSDISPAPTFTYNGDKIVMSNVSRPSLSDKRINFSYDDSQLSEGSIGGIKSFSGTITFFNASELSNELIPTTKKVHSGEQVEWTWKITSLSTKKAEDIHTTLNLPAGLVIVPSSITKNGSPATIGDLDGTNSLGDLDTGQVIIFTFKTTATGTVDEWLEAKGRLDWEDDTITSPYDNESKAKVQIQDDEQTYTPKDSDDIALQSVPIYFNHGTNPVMPTAQTYQLHPMNYQSNTNVVTDGFYTRVKDDRATSTGWKLTAKLSEFRDSGNQVMPNGAGTSLKLENMTIERVTDRDTPQEVIDPTPSGADVPSSVTATETLVAGQATAKTLVHAQVNEGRETWQLRMPFDKVSLNVPANAGKKATRYKARLTWSLDDTL